MNYLEFKGEGSAELEDIYSMQPALIIVLGAVLQFCKDNSLPCKVTNVRHKFAQSISNTHPEGRAFDMSVRGWTGTEIKRCIHYVEKEVGHLGAISKNSGVRVVAVYHDVGLGKHIHFQTQRGL